MTIKTNQTVVYTDFSKQYAYEKHHSAAWYCHHVLNDLEAHHLISKNVISMWNSDDSPEWRTADSWSDKWEAYAALLIGRKSREDSE